MIEINTRVSEDSYTVICRHNGRIYTSTFKRESNRSFVSVNTPFRNQLNIPIELYPELNQAQEAAMRMSNLLYDGDL